MIKIYLSRQMALGMNAERNLAVTTLSRCCGRRWCRHEDWSKIDVKNFFACWERLSSKDVMLVYYNKVGYRTTSVESLGISRFYVPPDSKYVVLETLFPANLLAKYWKKNLSNTAKANTHPWQNIQQHINKHENWRQVWSLSNLELEQVWKKNQVQ